MNEIFLTKDGSHSVRSNKFQVAYHSLHGAIQESNHVFLDAGLHYFPAAKEIHLLEIGFGTGLNALLTALVANTRPAAIHYTALEKYPLSLEEIQALNYGLQLNAQTEFIAIHESPWEQTESIQANFHLLKRKLDFLNLQAQEKFDLIYFDAFAPTAQPELWTKEALGIFIRSLKSGGVLTTYCAKGVVRRNFIELGCTAERLPGPPGKREMLRIIKN